jgi:ribosomal protein S18 acetylase RimI-like enzyme
VTTAAAVTVRRAGLDDLSTVVELRLALLREYGDHPVYGNLRADAEERAYDLYRAQLASPYEAIFLAERQGEVIGLVRCVDSPSSPLLMPDRYCYMSSVYVRPEHRRGGALRSMLARAEEWCAERGLREIRLHNSSSSEVAESAWSALGFEIVEHVRRLSLTGQR